MRKITLLLAAISLALLAIHGNLAAGSQSDSLKHSPLRKGAKALQFQIAPDFQLSSFQGAVFSGKYHTSKRSAWRVGLDLSGSFSDSEQNRQITQDDTLEIVEKIEGEGNLQSLGIVAQYVYYPNPGKKIDFYLGTGPYAQISRVSKDESREQTNPRGNPDVMLHTKDTRWAAGLSTIIGIEWFIGSRISLLAENRFLIGYTHWKNERTAEGSNSRDLITATYRTVEFKPLSVVFGVAAYF